MITYCSQVIGWLVWNVSPRLIVCLWVGSMNGRLLARERAGLRMKAAVIAVRYCHGWLGWCDLTCQAYNTTAYCHILRRCVRNQRQENERNAQQLKLAQSRHHRQRRGAKQPWPHLMDHGTTDYLSVYGELCVFGSRHEHSHIVSTRTQGGLSSTLSAQSGSLSDYPEDTCSFPRRSSFLLRR